MAKFRKVHTAFWDDPLMEKISPDARYFYLFLITNPLCTECGIYQITVKKMCNYTGYNEDSIRVLIKLFEVDNCRIVYDFATEEMCLLKKPNYIDNTGQPVKDCLMSEFTDVKNKNLILKQIRHIEKENVRKIYEAWYVSCYGTTYGTSKFVGQEEEKEEKRIEEEKEEGGGEKNLLAPQMVKIFKETYKTYPADKNQDFPACIEIAKKIASANGWQRGLVVGEKMQDTLQFWRSLVEFSATDQWFRTRSISDFNKEFQRLIQKKTNGSATHQQSSTANNTKLGTSDARVQKASGW